MYLYFIYYNNSIYSNNIYRNSRKTKNTKNSLRQLRHATACFCIYLYINLLDVVFCRKVVKYSYKYAAYDSLRQPTTRNSIRQLTTRYIVENKTVICLSYVVGMFAIILKFLL